MNNGFSTAPWIEGSGRETLSPYLFTIALEIVAGRIRRNSKIQGFRIGDVLCLFVDDMACFLRDRDSYITCTISLLHHFALLLHITLHYITLHYITLHYIILYYIILYYITLHYITLHYITLHYITLHYIILYYIILYYIILYYIILYYIILYYIILYYIILYIEDITWPRGDTKFLFECWKIFHGWAQRTSEIFFNMRREISYL